MLLNTNSIFNYFYNDIGLLLSFTPILISFWGAFALLANKRRTKAQVFLAFSFIIIGLGALFSFWYDRYEITNRDEIIRSINLIFTILVTISALLYFIVLMDPLRLTKRYIIILAIFALSFIAAILIFDLTVEKTENITGYKQLFENITSPTSLFRLCLSLMLVTFEIYALITVFKMYKRHKKFIREFFSYQEDIHLDWILYSIVLFSLLGLADLSWILDSSLTTKSISTLMMLIILCHIFWLGFRQDPVPLIGDCEEEENVKKETENQSNILFKENLKQKLFDYFETQKPYLNENLNLTDVACALNTNRVYLSQTINEDIGMNFYSFVNQYRIKYAIELIKKQGNKQTIDSLSADAGFKSKSVFYKQFRDITGLSPTEYIQKQLDNE